MRALRNALATAALLGAAPSLASAQSKPIDYLTHYVPVFRGVDHDLSAAQVKGTDPAVKAAVEACTVEYKDGAYTVRDGVGKIVRRFADTNGAKSQREGEPKAIPHLDQWSYYKDGFEVYREIDKDEDGSLDEVRWLNAGGTRIAQVQPVKGGGVRVAAWSRISAEEASKVLVQAIITGDNDLLESVLATPEELSAIGAPKSTLDRAAQGKAERTKALSELLAVLKATGWTGATTWSRFFGDLPRTIPADAAPGIKNEFTLYENVAIFADAGNPAANAKIAYLIVPDVVKLGESWKFIDMPHSVDPAKPTGGSLVSLRTDIFKSSDVGPEMDDDLKKALEKLAKHDSEPLPAGAAAREVATWHLARVKILNEVIAASQKPEDKDLYQKQAVNDLAEAIRTDLYPDGLGVIDKLAAQGGKVGSFAAYRKILVEFELAADQPGANLIELQKASLQKFEKFLKDYPTSDEAPDALLQLATVSDFNGDEEQAKTWFARLAKDYPDSEAGKKAVGALRRLGIDGKPMQLAGEGLDGKPVSLESYKGKPAVVLYWTSMDARDIQDLAALREKLGAKGFEVVGVSLDNDRETVEAAMKDAPSTFRTIYEPGGMDSRLANEMGIISTPTMILLDAKGNVVNRKIRKADEVERALDKALAGRGVSLK